MENEMQKSQQQGKWTHESYKLGFEVEKDLLDNDPIWKMLHTPYKPPKGLAKAKSFVKRFWNGLWDRIFLRGIYED